MDFLNHFISTVDYALNTKRKRHIAGGVLLSISTLFGGLAITVITMRNSDEPITEQKQEDYYNEYDYE